jgi:hypothetical protein
VTDRERDTGSSEGGPRDLPGDEAGDRSIVRSELLAALEICGLTGLAFTRPVLDSFGRSPETFLARGAAAGDVVLFGLAVALIPALAVVVVGVASRLAGPVARRYTHLALIGLLGGVAAWRLGTDAAPWGPRALVALGLVGAAVLVVLRYRARPTATYLRFLGAASVVFLIQFLVLSPSASLVTGGGGSETAGSVAEAALGADGEAPPIVMVVVDALPTATLLDGTGQIDEELYPNIARLADDSTWYRNHTTTAAWTFQAVPAMLTGRMPVLPSPLPDTRSYPDNLFTLFGDTHDITAVEQITRLCPEDVCPPEGGSALPTMLGDAVDWWRGALDTRQGDGARILPGALEPDRADEFVEWVDRQDFDAGGDPGLWFYHLVLPHDPWVVLDDLSTYEAVQEEPYGLFLHAFWDEVGPDVAHQRHILQTQATDRILGMLFDELREAGTYDESLIVVVGDHGESFVGGERLRGLTAEQYEQVAWTPLLVKAPGQEQGTVDDANVWGVDVVPTIADELGIELSWDIDGVPASEVDGARDAGDKPFLDSEFHELEPEDGGPLIALDGRDGLERVLAADPVEGEGELAVWQRTVHGALVGRAVDDLDVADEAGGVLRVERLDRIEDQGDDPPMLELIGRGDIEPGQVVAVTVNGVVAAVAPVGPGTDGQGVAHALLLPRPFTEANEVNAFLVEGEAGAATLRPLTVGPG